jgi:hypothetical protein
VPLTWLWFYVSSRSPSESELNLSCRLLSSVMRFYGRVVIEMSRCYVWLSLLCAALKLNPVNFVGHHK